MANGKALTARAVLAWTVRMQEALPAIVAGVVLAGLAAFGWLCLETIAHGKALARIEAKLDALADRLPARR